MHGFCIYWGLLTGHNALIVLLRHLKRKNEAVFKSYTNYRDSASTSGQPTMDGFMSSAKYKSNHPEQQRITQLILKNLIVKGSLPFGIVETDWFREFIDAVNSKYTLPSRSHLTTKLLPELAQATKLKVSAYIEKADSIALTFDIWTDRRMHSFLTITGHSFVNFVSQSFLVAFCGSHSGQNIAEAVDRCLTKYDVHEKVQYFVTDNASNMRKTFCVLEEFAKDVDMGMALAGLGDDNLWNDLELTNVEDVSLIYFICFI